MAGLLVAGADPINIRRAWMGPWYFHAVVDQILHTALLLVLRLLQRWPQQLHRRPCAIACYIGICILIN